MTASRDPDRLIRAFLEEGPDQLPDRSYDAVRSRIDRTRQRAVIGPWREPRMSNIAKFAMAAAAVLVIAVVGYNLLPGNSGVGGPHPTASPTLAPTPSPAPTPGSLEGKPNGLLSAGSYYINNGNTQNTRLTLTVPAGWARPNATDTFVIKNEGTPGEVFLGTWVVSHVFADVCHWSADSLVDVGTTTDQLVSALVAQKGRQASTPTDLTVAGFPAKRVELAVAPTLDVATCTQGFLRYWPAPGPDLSGGMCCNPAGNTDVIYVVDSAGKRLVIVARYYPGSTAADKAELQAIVDTLQIEP
jgi:hypothetical protein